jgi:protein-tyrosine phosphatase
MRFGREQKKYTGNVIDLHCHVLPDVDDGAVSFEKSVNMLRIAVGEKTVVLAATPHLVFDGSEKLYTARIKKAYETLQALIAENNLPIKVVLGYELLLSSSLLHNSDICDYVIEGTNRVLVEPNLTEPPDLLEELVYDLEHYNIGLILAHPERNEWLVRDLSYLQELAARGVLLQVNAGSITGKFGRTVEHAARRLAGAGLVHLIGSDAHSDKARGPYVQEALAVLSNWIGGSPTADAAYKRAAMLFQLETTNAGEA